MSVYFPSQEEDWQCPLVLTPRVFASDPPHELTHAAYQNEKVKGFL